MCLNSLRCNAYPGASFLSTEGRYANVIRDYHKVADLINELCEDGYELQHGGVDIAVKMRVEREIAEAPPILLDPDAEPLVTVIWSESADLRDGEQMPLSQADAVFKALDDAMKDEPGYADGLSPRACISGRRWGKTFQHCDV